MSGQDWSYKEGHVAAKTEGEGESDGMWRTTSTLVQDHLQHDPAMLTCNRSSRTSSFARGLGISGIPFFFITATAVKQGFGEGVAKV